MLHDACEYEHGWDLMADLKWRKWSKIFAKRVGQWVKVSSQARSAGAISRENQSAPQKQTKKREICANYLNATSLFADIIVLVYANLHWFASST